MAERKSWATMAPAGAGQIQLEDARLALGALLTPGSSSVSSQSGFRPGPVSPGLVSATGTPDAFVHVNPFQAFLQTVRAAAGGTYVITNDAAITLNILAVPADPTNPRHDLVIAQQSDTGYSDPNSNMVVSIVRGTPSGAPTDPAVSGSTDYIKLARINVRAGTSSILTTDITDLRAAGLYTVAVGGVLPVPTQAVRDAITGAYNGMTIYRQDRKWTEIYDGAAWRVHGPTIVTSIADLAAITSPLTGQTAVNTASGLTYRYTGAVWIGLPGGIMGAPTSTAADGTPTSGTTETRDSILGNYVFTAVAGRRYRAMFTGRVLNGSVSGDRFLCNVRNGGGSTPTAASALIGQSINEVQGVGAPGFVTLPVIDSFIPGAGTVTLGVFFVRGTGTGVCTPTAGCELYAEDIGGV